MQVRACRVQGLLLSMRPGTLCRQQEVESSCCEQGETPALGNLLPTQPCGPAAPRDQVYIDRKPD